MPARANPIARFTANADVSGTLPAHYYFDPEIWRRENEQIWFKTWQYAGHLGDLQNPGDFITTTLIDQPILVVRAKDGSLRAFYNVCMHRGHILAEACGNKRIFTCPFHAWSYDTTGALKAAGNAENVAGFQHEDFHLAEIRVETLGWMVFVNLDAQARPLADMADGMLDNMRERIPGFDDLVYVETTTFDVAANWKFILDGLECYHCPVIHPQAMGKEDSYLTNSFETTEHEYWMLDVVVGNYEVIEKNRDKLPYDFGPATLKDVNIWFLWPNLIFVAHQGPTNLKILHATTVGPETSVRHIRSFCLQNPPSAYDRANIDNYCDIVFPQDKRAMELQAAGVRSRGYGGGRLMVDAERSWRSEHGTHHFDNLVWLALNGPEYEAA